MRTQFTFLLFVIFSAFSYAQTFYNLEVVAEGNFGSTNADVYTVTNYTNPTSTSAGAYQTANSSAGFDVLQDFGVFGNKALMIEKPSGPGRITIVDYPAFTEVHTFTTSDAPQTLVMASQTKGYVATGNPKTIQFVDLVNNTIAPVADPNNNISATAQFMLQANGFIYAQMGSNVIKVDTLTQTISGVVAPGIGTIKGMVFDELTNLVWVMNGSGSLISVDVLNSDVIGTEILTGVPGSTLLRKYDSKLYFWNLSNKELFIYNTVTSSTLPLVSSYTSTLAGGSWSFGYGRSFDIDENTGDFAICSADGFAAPSLFEVVDGTTFTVIDSGSATGVAIANKCILKTFPAGSAVPVPDVAILATVNAECEATLTAPTADVGTITATTNDPLTYSTQGTFTVTWTYTNSNGTETQTQEVVIEDETAPMADVTPLPTLELSCDSIIVNFPVATDNCAGIIIATTVDPLSYATAGTYTINWTYVDAVGNETQQTQAVQVTCSDLGLSDYAVNNVNIYPNPATDVLNIETDEVNFVGQLMNTQGQTLMKFENQKTIQIGDLPNGVYYLKISNISGVVIKKIVKK
ncbi:T9SS type A sorting domain-containing protein [Brumimicrobium glaciale]|uniref:T9SS type A sorting domain-containing protein n=1 Tax=Brumimicrobium glaciale TaxID=200475 RepID=A0A4Q4KNM0_9FLAO|nr:T9SS type A sorting domain-containing protein [Brumimicrobium glaciale]RYM34972.1 T9SS type A sorting domain-containing protein [Brumimicrobium glaciale]